MKYLLKTASIICVFAVMCTACKKEDNQAKSAKTSEKVQSVSSEKIISLNGGITETLAALGYEKNIVATDVTSVYPEDLKKTAQVLGHVRTISIEPILAMSPSLILASEADMNPDLHKKLQESGIKTVFYQPEYSVKGAKKLIEEVAKTVGNDKYQTLYQNIDEAIAKIKPIAQKPKVVFIYARGNNLMVSGKDTPMSSLIDIAGGHNPIQDFEGFKPLTPEALIKYNPDFLLFFTDGLQGSGGIDGVLKVPGVSQTTAGKNKQIIAMDGGLMSSFGPRVGQAALTLNQLLSEHTH